MSSISRWYECSSHEVKDCRLTVNQNLGLGVLKMKDADESSESSSDSEMSDVEDDTAKEKDVLGKLMGQEKPTEPAGIQEVNEQQRS